MRIMFRFWHPKMLLENYGRMHLGLICTQWLLVSFFDNFDQQ